MSTLRQPFRLLLGISNVAVKLGIGPDRVKLLAQAESRRQLSKPPFWMTRPGDRGITTQEHLAPGRGGPVRVRTYLPPGLRPDSPAIVYLHGGGFVLGGLDGCDYITRGLASRTGYPVFSVEYRLSPECSFPGALEDCEDALRWVAETRPEGIDPARIAVGGDSAGGNLAASLALLVRDSSGPTIRHQTLVYPLTDCTVTSPSWLLHKGGGIDVAAGRDMVRHYAPHHAADHPLVSPLHAPDLSGLPPALVITAEVDVLNYDGRDYAERLLTAGVPVVYRDYPGIPHGFVTMPRLSRDSDHALDLIASEMVSALTASTTEPA